MRTSAPLLTTATVVIAMAIPSAALAELACVRVGYSVLGSSTDRTLVCVNTPLPTAGVDQSVGDPSVVQVRVGVDVPTPFLVSGTDGARPSRLADASRGTGHDPTELDHRGVAAVASESEAAGASRTYAITVDPARAEVSARKDPEEARIDLEVTAAVAGYDVDVVDARSALPCEGSYTCRVLGAVIGQLPRQGELGAPPVASADPTP